MDTYIVRVYRRGLMPVELIGLVETIGKDDHDKFKSFEELKEILRPRKGIKRKTGGNKNEK